MEKVSEIAAKFNLIVIEDAPVGLVPFGGQHVASKRRMFRFHPRKSITTGKVGW